jgi:hypothetical protein
MAPEMDPANMHQALIIFVGVRSSDWEQIEIFGKAKCKWFSTFFDLPNGIPSHNTFRRVLSGVNAKKIQECFVGWVQSVAQVIEGEVPPIDGKTLRRSHDSSSGKAAIHIVSA